MSEKTDLVEVGTVTLKINNVSTYMTVIGKHTRSPPHQVAGIGWHILAFPSLMDKITYLSCYLAGVNANKWTAWVDATFRIVTAGGGVGKKRSFHKHLMGKEPLGVDWGWQMFATSEALLSVDSGFVVDDSVEIRVDFSVSDVCGASLRVFDTDGALAADIKLKVGTSVFYANKGICTGIVEMSGRRRPSKKSTVKLTNS